MDLNSEAGFVVVTQKRSGNVPAIFQTNVNATGDGVDVIVGLAALIEDINDAANGIR